MSMLIKKYLQNLVQMISNSMKTKQYLFIEQDKYKNYCFIILLEKPSEKELENFNILSSTLESFGQLILSKIFTLEYLKDFNINNIQVRKFNSIEEYATEKFQSYAGLSFKYLKSRLSNEKLSFKLEYNNCVVCSEKNNAFLNPLSEHLFMILKGTNNEFYKQIVPSSIGDLWTCELNRSTKSLSVFSFYSLMKKDSLKHIPAKDVFNLTF